MLRNRLTLCTIALMSVFAGLAWAAPAEEAAASKKKGDELLAKADFDGALKAYAAAAKTDAANQEYRTEYAILRRVIAMREAVGVEKNLEKWQNAAKGLRSYYHMHKLYNEALAIDKQLHSKLNNSESATLLADTYLALDQGAEAEKLLSGLDAAKMTPDTMILLAIAQARQSKIAEAKATAAKVKLPADADPNILYNYACLQARVDDKAGAGATLTRCFEQIPPSRLAATKEHARQDKDLAGMVTSPEFASAMKAESKVKESKCSGGGDCGSCSKKGGCSSAGGGNKASCPDHKANEAPAEKK